MGRRTQDLSARLPPEWFSTMDPSLHWQYLGPRSTPAPGLIGHTGRVHFRRTALAYRSYLVKPGTATPRPISYQGETSSLSRALYAHFRGIPDLTPIPAAQRRLARLGDPRFRRSMWAGITIRSCSHRWEGDPISCVNPHHATLLDQRPSLPLLHDELILHAYEEPTIQEWAHLVTDWCADHPRASMDQLRAVYAHLAPETFHQAGLEADLSLYWRSQFNNL